jgi:hypothetical protein
MEGITPQVMLVTRQYNPTHPQYNDTHEYLYFLMSIPRGLCQPPIIIILFPFNYIVDLFHYYGHITFIIPLGTSLGTLHSIPLSMFCPRNM